MNLNQKALVKQNIYRCANACHHNFSFQSIEKCKECGELMVKKWLPFDVEEKLEVEILALIKKSEIKSAIQLLRLSLHDDFFPIDPDWMFGLIDLRKIENGSQIFSDPYNLSTIEQWKDFYLKNISIYSSRLLKQFESIYSKERIDYIISPQTNSYYLIDDLVNKFVTKYKAKHITLNKVNPEFESTTMKTCYMEFKEPQIDIEIKSVVFIDDTISQFKTLNGMVQAVKKNIKSAEIYACTFLIDDTIDNKKANNKQLFGIDWEAF